jgi:hypothetical protein
LVISCSCDGPRWQWRYDNPRFARQRIATVVDNKQPTLPAVSAWMTVMALSGQGGARRVMLEAAGNALGHVTLAGVSSARRGVHHLVKGGQGERGGSSAFRESH